MSGQRPGSGSTLALVSLSHGVNHAQGALKPLIYPALLREFGVGYSELGIMLGVAGALGGGLQLVAGGLGTVVRRNLLLGFGNLLGGLCIALSALSPNFGQFFLWNAAERVGSAAQHPVGSSLIAHHFHQHRLGMALATHFSAGNIGTAVIPLVAAILISLWGWRPTTILFALPALLVGIALCLWVTDPRSHPAGESRTGTTSVWRAGAEALRNARFRWIVISLVVAAGGSGHGALSVYLPLHLSNNLGLEAVAIGFIFSLFMIGSIAGPLVGGRLADRYRRKPIVVGAALLTAAVTAAFPHVAAQPLILPLAALLLGATAFGIHPILQTVVAEVTRDEVRDIAFAVFYSAAFLAGALWSPVIGYVAQSFGLEVTFAAMGASFVAAALCLLASRLDAADEPVLAQARSVQGTGEPSRPVSPR